MDLKFLSETPLFRGAAPQEVAETEIDICFQASIGTGFRNCTLTFQFASFHCLYVRTVFVS